MQPGFYGFLRRVTRASINTISWVNSNHHMEEKRIAVLKNMIATTDSVVKRTWALWLLLTNHGNELTTDELLQYIPLIWQVDLFSADKFPGIRQKIEQEIRLRQNEHTIRKLLELLENSDPNARFVALDLLNDFRHEMIIAPLLAYLQKTNDDFMTRRQGICALGKYHDERIKLYLEAEYERNKDNTDMFFRSNFLWIIDVLLKKY